MMTAFPDEVDPSMAGETTVEIETGRSLFRHETWFSERSADGEYTLSLAN